VAKPFDATLKLLIQEYPADWLRLLGLPAARVDLLDADLSTITSEADKVLRVQESSPWLLHLELQSGNDPTIGQRLLRYNVLLRARHDLPVHSAVVLLRTAANHPAITGELEWGLPGRGSYLTFRYQVHRVWEMSVEAILAGGIGTIPLAPLTAVDQAALPEVVRWMKGRLPGQSADVASLWSASYILAGLEYPPEFVQSLFAGVRAMKESSTYQAILEEGRVEGRVEGRAEGARDMLISFGTDKLGPPDAEALAALRAISEVGRLQELVHKLWKVSSWKELLAPPRLKRKSR
jgi:predicted transposase YdaD